MNKESGAHLESLPPSGTPADQRSEELEEVGAGIDQLHQHQHELADRLQQDQHYVEEIQAEVTKEAEEARHLTEELGSSTEQERTQ